MALTLFSAITQFDDLNHSLILRHIAESNPYMFGDAIKAIDNPLKDAKTDPTLALTQSLRELGELNDQIAAESADHLERLFKAKRLIRGLSMIVGAYDEGRSPIHTVGKLVVDDVLHEATQFLAA